MLDPIIIAAIKASLASNSEITTTASKNKNNYNPGVPITSAINWDTIVLILSNINTASQSPVLSQSIDNDIFENRLFPPPSIPPEISYTLIAPNLSSCGSCHLVGGFFQLRGGISYPSGDGPTDFQDGYPLQASSCAELEEYIAAEPVVPGAEIIIGYPIDWTFQYADGEVISGSGCENLPEDVATMFSIVSSLDESGCVSTDRFTVSWLRNVAILTSGDPTSYFDPYVYCADGGYRLE